MKINELKIGDRVKYKIEYGIFEGNIFEGNILEIRSEFQIENNKYGNGQISVKSKDIISKLEPIQNYKETPIVREELFNSHPYICPKCNKSHGLTGIMIWGKRVQYCQYCQERITAPKSFKHEIKLTSYSDFNFAFDFVLPYLELGKTYIIEIKEKS